MEMFALLLFAAVLLVCVAFGLPLLAALAAGYVIFFCYGLARKYTARQLWKMSLFGVKTVQNILLLFLLIGMLTALWRASGAIPAIVYYASGLIRPSVMLLTAFLLNCLVSTLTGTSFGTSATMGVICMTMMNSAGVNPILGGGAILSGALFGDRCSPVSTSALLVSELTGTDLYRNIRGMIKTAVVPFLLACAVYAVLGLMTGGGGKQSAEMGESLAAAFRLGWLPLVPAALVLVLAAFRVNVRITISLSIVSAFLISVLYQHMPAGQALLSAVTGYRCGDEALSASLDGGGVVSMLRAVAIVCLSSSYAGIFEGTGLLNGLEEKVLRAGQKVSPFACILGVSLLSAAVACNQTLTILLTNQICRPLEPDRERLALALENTAVIVAPLIPWSIAAAVPLSSVGAPNASVLAACYLYLVPLWSLVTQKRSRRTAARV